MSTHQTTLKPDPAPLPANAYCPTCGQLLPPLQIQEYPKAMYKAKPKEVTAPTATEEDVETIIVHDAEEEKKKKAQGYSEEVPKPKPAGNSKKP